MRSTISVQGVDDALKALGALNVSAIAATRTAIQMAAVECRTNSARSIEKQSQGQWQRRSRQGGGTYAHMASNPGDAPNTDTGTLVGSIAWEFRGDLTAYVGTNVEYGKYLELGTSTMAARPWLMPSADAVDLSEMVAKAVDFQIKKASK